MRYSSRFRLVVVACSLAGAALVAALAAGGLRDPASRVAAGAGLAWSACVCWAAVLAGRGASGKPAVAASVLAVAACGGLSLLALPPRLAVSTAYVVTLLAAAALNRPAAAAGLQAAAAAVVCVSLLRQRVPEAAEMAAVVGVAAAVVTVWSKRASAAWERQVELFDQARWAASQFVNVNVRMQDNVDRSAGAARIIERVRVAREVHDTVGYTLTAALVQVRAVRRLMDDDPGAAAARLGHVEEMLQESIQEVRAEVSHLRDESYASRVGSSRWQRLCETFGDSTGVRVSTTFPESLETVDEGLSETVYRIIQEALTNAYRHGRADHVDVAMSWEQERERVLLRISDNGRGTAAVDPGNGLSGMRERVRALNGSLVWQSMPDRGFDLGIELGWKGVASG